MKERVGSRSVKDTNYFIRGTNSHLLFSSKTHALKEDKTAAISKN